jgi:hypothetical protein
VERGAGIENVQKMLIRPVEDRTNYVPILRLSLVKFVAATGLVTLWALGFLDLILASDHMGRALVDAAAYENGRLIGGTAAMKGGRVHSTTQRGRNRYSLRTQSDSF